MNIRIAFSGLPAPGHAKSLQSCLALQPHGLSVAHQVPLSMGILQARILEWVAISSSGGSSQPWDRTHVSSDSCTVGRFLTTEPPAKPTECLLISGEEKHSIETGQDAGWVVKVRTTHKQQTSVQCLQVWHLDAEGSADISIPIW